MGYSHTLCCSTYSQRLQRASFMSGYPWTRRENVFAYNETVGPDLRILLDLIVYIRQWCYTRNRVIADHLGHELDTSIPLRQINGLGSISFLESWTWVEPHGQSSCLHADICVPVTCRPVLDPAERLDSRPFGVSLCCGCLDMKTFVPAPPDYVVDFDHPQRQFATAAYWCYGLGVFFSLLFTAQRIYVKAALQLSWQLDDCAFLALSVCVALNLFADLTCLAQCY